MSLRARPLSASPRSIRVNISLLLASLLFTLVLTVGLEYQSPSKVYADKPTSTESSTAPSTASPTKRAKKADKLHSPLPTNKRGFWGTFFFWSGGVLAMYLVGRRVFREQSHQRRTLQRLRDELGHFFPEFEPINITKWVQIAADHVFYAWREGDLSTMESFVTPRFMSAQESKRDAEAERGERHQSHLNKVLAVHTLGMEWGESEEAPHPPLGVKLILRVEVSAIDFHENTEGDLIRGQRKPKQFQWIWSLLHDGKSWVLDDVHPSQGDITHLNQLEDLPPIAQWRRPDGVNETSSDTPEVSEETEA